MRDIRNSALPALLTSAVWALITLPAAAANVTFAVPRAQLITTIKTVGVMPVEMDEAVPNPDEVAARLEQDITQRLQRAGFTVVPASEMRAIRARGLTTLGGVYDPMTGLPNREKVDAVREFSRQEYRVQHPVDGILRLGIVRRSAEFNVGWSEWDGVRERVTSVSGLADVMAQGMVAGVHRAGTVPALSLGVNLVDARGETLYTGVGGLLVLGYPTVGGSMAGYDLSAAGPKGGLEDPAITARALTIALDPLATGAVSDKSLEFKLRPTAKDTGAHAPMAVADLLREHPRVALASLEIPPPAPEQAERVQGRYREMLTARFTALGFEVVSGNDFDGLWAAERSGAGGFYDAFTGRPDHAKLDTAMARVLARLRERYGIAGVIVPSIVPRKAPSAQGYAHWDGAAEPVSGGGSLLFNKSIFNPNLNFAGHLDANSLKVRVLDSAGQVLYQGYGGVELTQHLDHGRFVLVPESSLFADGARDTAAVDAALHGLAPRPNQRH
jgi:hypothetical protein